MKRMVFGIVLLSLIVGMLMNQGFGVRFVVFASKFNPGDIIEVINSSVDGGLRVRDALPPVGNVILPNKYDGDLGMILAGPQTAYLDGTLYTWWKIRWQDVREGWSAEGDNLDDFLRRVSVSSSTTFSVGDSVKVYNTGSLGLNVRTDPPSLSDTGTNVFDGKVGTVVGGPFYGVAENQIDHEFHHFWKVNYGSIVGWSAQDWLIAGTPTCENQLWITPSELKFSKDTTPVGTKFNITVWVNIAVKSFTWQVKLLFNSSQLRVSKSGFTYWYSMRSDFFKEYFTFAMGPIIDNVRGFVAAGETLLRPDVRDPGSGSLIWVEFEIIAAPPDGGSLTSELDVTSTYPDDTFLWFGDFIPLETLNATYEFKAVPDFSLTASPTSLTIQQGSSDTSTITVASRNGFNQPVQLSVSGVPSGVTAALNPQEVTPPATGSTTSTLTVSVGTTATVGSYALAITGISGALTHSTQISLEITAGPQNEWTFAVITDLHIGRGYDYNGEIGRDFPEYDKKEDYYLTQRLQQVVDWIKTAESIRFVVVLGDITEHGRTCEMEKAKGILDTLGAIPYFPVIGNHDIKAEGDSVFDNVFDDNFFMTQCGKLGVEWNNGRIHVPVDLDPYVPGAELEWRFQNYAFVYNNKRFVFLDYVDRGVDIGTPNLNVPTEDFLQTQLQYGNPTILFSHHPMIEAWSTGCFLGDDIQAIGDVITGTTANVLGNFAGHLHGYFDPAKRFDPYDHLPPPPANPHYMFSNVEYAGEYNTPAGISVFGTEALMVASNELCDWPSMSKGIIRIVRLAGDTFSTSEEGEFSSPSMNPYFARVDREDPPWGKVTYEFTVYAFNKWFTAENPGTYILDYGDGTQPASLTSTRWDDEPKVFKHDYEGGRSYDVVLRVTGSTAEGQQGDESIKIKIEVPRPWNAFRVKCPVDMIITDPDGHRISKLINEIPGATYTEADLDEDGEIDKLVLIPTLIDGDYTVTLNGTDTGVYHMIAEFVTAGGIVNFTATEIPVSLGATHNFTISWAALFRGEEGVTVQVDSDDDGVFEHAFASGSELTQNEYMTVLCDVNDDGKVDLKDISLAARAFGTSNGDVLWNPMPDINADNHVDIRDIAQIAKHFGQHYP